MSAREREERLAAWLAGQDDPALGAALADDLGDPAAAARAGELLAIDRLLPLAAGDDAAAFAAEVVAALGARDSGRRFARRVAGSVGSRRRRPLLAGALLAAAALVALLLLRGGGDVAVVSAVAGDVVAQRGGRAGALAVGERLAPGDSIAASGGSATLAWRDGTTIAVGPLARLALADAAGAKALRLDAGELRAHVAHQPPGRPLVIATPFARAEVVGTRFRLTVAPDAATLVVDEGAVRFAARGRDVVVGGGERARADAVGVAIIAAATLPPRAFPCAGAGDARAEPWRQGDVVARADAPGGRCLQATVDETLSPRALAVLMLDWSTGLFQPRAGDRIAFAYRAPAGAERLIVWIYDSTRDRGFYRAVEHPPAAAWTVAELAFDDFSADAGASDRIAPGDALSVLRVSVEPATEAFQIADVRLVAATDAR